MSHQPPLLLNPVQPTGIGALREKKTFIGGTVKLLTSLKTTAVLGATLGTLLFPAATLSLAKSAVPKTFGGKLLAVTGISALTTSPRLRKLVVKKLNPISTGRELGKLVEDPSKLLPKDTTGKGVKEKVLNVFKTAGLIGGVAAAGVGAVVLGKAAVKKVKSLIPGGAPTATTTSALVASAPIGATPVFPAISSITTPIGAVEKPTELEKAATPTPSIKIVNKPQNTVNVKFSKSKKFINQQINVKP